MCGHHHFYVAASLCFSFLGLAGQPGAEAGTASGTQSCLLSGAGGFSSGVTWNGSFCSIPDTSLQEEVAKRVHSGDRDGARRKPLYPDGEARAWLPGQSCRAGTQVSRLEQADAQGRAGSAM